MGDIIVIIVLLLIIGAVAAYMIRNKKKGKSSCGCSGCGSCPYSSSCHKK